MMPSRTANPENTTAIVRGIGRTLRRLFDPAAERDLPDQHRQLIVELQRREQSTGEPQASD